MAKIFVIQYISPSLSSLKNIAHRRSLSVDPSPLGIRGVSDNRHRKDLLLSAICRYEVEVSHYKIGILESRIESEPRPS